MQIIAADKIVDGMGSLKDSESLLQEIQNQRLRIRQVNIASMTPGWHHPLPELTLKGAYAPLLAIKENSSDMNAETFDVLVIYGKDQIKTNFRDKKEQRQRLMQIYGDVTVLDAYNLLAHEFIKEFGMTIKQFKWSADQLFRNYLRTWKKVHGKDFPY